jgi:pyroglutamyl-peptidase
MFGGLKKLKSYRYVIRDENWGCGGIGRRAGFKIPFSQESMGSSPIIPTLFYTSQYIMFIQPYLYCFSLKSFSRSFLFLGYKTMDTILLSGFTPFGGCTHNSAQDVVRALDGDLDTGQENERSIHIIGCVLPVVHTDSWTRLYKEIEKHKPIAVVSLGQSIRPQINLERIAQNYEDFRIPDNAGNQPQGRSVIDNAPTSYPTTLPIDLLSEGLNKEGIDVVFSDSAGTFVCNHLFFHLQHVLQGRIPSGFIHLPFSCTPQLIDEVRTLLGLLCGYIRLR